MIRRLIILLLIVGCVFAHGDTYDKIYYDTGLVLDCVSISKEYDINLEWNFFLPINYNISCLAPSSNFSTIDGTLELKNASEMYWFPNPDENGNRKIWIPNISKIEKITYRNGEIKHPNEIQSSYRKWKYGVNLSMVGILILIVNIT